MTRRRFGHPDTCPSSLPGAEMKPRFQLDLDLWLKLSGLVRPLSLGGASDWWDIRTVS